MQFVGLGLLFGIYVVQGVKFIVWDMPREKLRTQKKIEEIDRINKALEAGDKLLVQVEHGQSIAVITEDVDEDRGTFVK